MDSNSFRDRLRGLGWFVAACQIVSQMISIAVLVILYPRLGPEPFGVLAMALPAVNLGRLIAGFGIATSGVASDALDEESQSALFWYGLGWSLLVAGLVSLSGIALARFFAEPALIRIVPALAVTMIFAAMGLLNQVRLERAMRLSTVAATRVVALALGGVAAIAAAVLGAGVWALVLQQLVEWGALTIGFWIAGPWLPRIVRPSAAAWLAFRQGGTFTASSLAFWLAQNIDTIVVGRWGGAYPLGLYSQAYNLIMKPVLLVTTPLTAVMLPTLSRSRNSPAEYQQLLRAFFRTAGILLFPCGMGLLVFPVNVMELIGGKDWAEGELILRTLAPLILMQGFVNICGSVFASLGRFDRLLKGALTYAATISFATVVAAWRGTGNLGWQVIPIADSVALGVTLATALFLFPYLRYCLKSVPIAGSAIVRAVRMSAVAAIGMAMGVLLVPGLVVTASEIRPGSWWLASTTMVFGIVIYAILAAGEIRWLIRREDDKA
jgi:PST family polysaccharide transporter